jgi:hypothetical protein
MSQGKLAAIEDLLGQRNWREFDHQFYFLFLVQGFGGKVGPATNGKEPSKIELASGKQQKANPRELLASCRRRRHSADRETVGAPGPL